MKVTVSTKGKWNISPYLNMQFMEPLSVTDSSVDAGWDYVNHAWHKDLIDVVSSLAPGMVRWGGCFASYYHWREGVGEWKERIPMLNLCWDGVYSNEVGTREIVDFCRQVHAEPLMVLNMESDGRKKWAYPCPGADRAGTAEEAADWIHYCNDEHHVLREKHGSAEPYRIKWWQIGNETSYDPDGFSVDQACAVTKRFAEKALEADPTLHLIAWGDNGWAEKMCQSIGSSVSHIAFHYHYGSGLPQSPLYDPGYRKNPKVTWEHLMSVPDLLDKKIKEMKEEVQPFGKRLAMTEGHFSLNGRNRCDVLSTWMAGVSYARNHQIIMRNSDVLDIATMADFFGNRWQVNAILIPTPHGKAKPYLQPVGQIMRLFGRWSGTEIVEVQTEADVDVVASKKDNVLFVHAVNKYMDKSVQMDMKLDNEEPIESLKVYEIAPEDPMEEVTPDNNDFLNPKIKTVKGNNYRLPPAGVAVLEIQLKP